MDKRMMELTIQISTLPFTTYALYDNDIFGEQSEISSVFNSLSSRQKRNEILYKLFCLMDNKEFLRNMDQPKMLMLKFFPYEKMCNSIVSKHYLNILSSLSRYFITHRNGRTALKYWKSKDEEEFLGPYEDYEKILLWHTLNNYMAVDLLVAMYYLENMGDEQYLPRFYGVQVMMEDLQLDKILNDGLAETHLHWKAGFEFDTVWCELMYIDRKSAEKYKEDFICDSLFDKNNNLIQHVKAMAISRLLMAEYLLVDSADGIKSFFEYIKKRLRILNTNDEEEKPDEEESLNDIGIFNAIYSGENIGEMEFYKLFEDLVKVKRENKQNDILLSIGYPEQPEPELLFLFKALKYIRNNKDGYFDRIFWQYIRVKNKVFQNKVQKKNIKGLDFFQKAFKRSTQFACDNKQRWKLTMKKQMQNSNLRKIEFRAGIGGKKDLQTNIINFLQAYCSILKEEKTRCVPDMGLIFHFNKREDNQEPLKCWQKQDVRSDYTHFGSLQRQYFEEAKILRAFRENIEGLDYYIVGIDAASIENNTEPWVFAPVFEEVRNSNTHRTLYEKSGRALKTLGFTFHVGEDFRHLLTGLRHIDEVIEHFKFHAGDRIGHGIALGINPIKWAKNNRVVILPRIEYLENLLWLWGLYKNGNVDVNWDIGYCEQCILKCAEQIYQKIEGITIYNLWKAYRDKFNEFDLNTDYLEGKLETECNKLFCAEVLNKDARGWDKEKLLHARHCQQYLIKMLEPIQIAVTGKDESILIAVQSLLVGRINSTGIVVETNPSSNTKIGEIEHIFEHYIQNLNRVGLETESEREALTMVTINTDDPSVFNTNLNNEFAYIFYALLNKGYARSQVLKWIDSVRECGMRSSFIENRCITREEKIEEIENILACLR